VCAVLKRPLLSTMGGQRQKRYLHARVKVNFKELKCYKLSIKNTACSTLTFGKECPRIWSIIQSLIELRQIRG
jgi:hypothetical protein